MRVDDRDRAESIMLTYNGCSPDTADNDVSDDWGTCENALFQLALRSKQEIESEIATSGKKMDPCSRPT